MAYCSRACQEKDWLSGHKLMCSKPFTKENSGQFQGTILPQTIPNEEREAIKLKELEINMSMIQLKLFLDNSERILSQARALVIPLYDLVVVFELLQCPPKITAVKYTNYFNTPESKKSFEDSRSKKNITCIYVSHYYDNSEKLGDDGVARRLVMQKFFDCSWLQDDTKKQFDFNQLKSMKMKLGQAEVPLFDQGKFDQGKVQCIQS